MTKIDPAALQGLLEFRPGAGEIRLRDYRMVLLSACAVGTLRKELVETLGPDRARGLLKRFGHAAGLADGLALAERFPTSSTEEQMAFGPALHALEGIAKVRRIHGESRIDLDNGVYHVEAYWENSFEAEQHLDLLGQADAPVCWMLAGYATGHSSAAAGRRTVVSELECRGKGDERCRFVVGFADRLPEHAQREEPDYEPQHLPRVLDDLLATIRRQKSALRKREKTITQLESRLGEREERRPGIAGESPALQQALEVAATVAPVDTTVLIHGESGTGKELFARMIHERSPRAQGPFVAVNCSALPESLEEAELFGFARGAFTGALAATPGLFEAAGGGTLFLDEIGDLSPSAQTKILRALQEREIKRLGETRARKVNVRVVAATHRDLRAMVAEGSFREDLYYRLSVIALELPPLRERGNDVLLLAQRFLERDAASFDKPAREFSRGAQCALLEHDWPGNVRELENAVQRAVILSRDATVDRDDLPATLAAAPAETGGRGAEHPELAAIEDEGERLARALELAGGHRVRAAALLGVSRTTLWRRMREHGSGLS